MLEADELAKGFRRVSQSHVNLQQPISLEPRLPLKAPVHCRSHTSFEDEANKLCNVSDPIHLDLQEAHRHGLRACRVPELLYAGLFPAIIGTHFPGSIYISQTLHFRNPVFVEENLRAQVKAIHLRNFRDKHRVEFATSCWKEENNIVAVEGVAVALLPSLMGKVSRC
ncbi:hypothetical protein GOP47_0020473 [Adiantum capillus-veneris]|uniref:MaoC-like domain-containing protein n=1 Tax=Adiantum capillus-veneris TaxID=13818 RepID=A0A9D4Z639_ADICA|nr:hypothetical protein GOP47_0020473 [Adiantum capillus-veneris]